MPEKQGDAMVPYNNGSQVVNERTSVSQSGQSIHVREIREYQSVREVKITNEGDDGSSKQIAKK